MTEEKPYIHYRHSGHSSDGDCSDCRAYENEKDLAKTPNLQASLDAVKVAWLDLNQALQAFSAAANIQIAQSKTNQQIPLPPSYLRF